MFLIYHIKRKELSRKDRNSRKNNFSFYNLFHCIENLNFYSFDKDITLG